MFNKTSATLMLQTIMVLMDKQNSTSFPGAYGDDVELERCYGQYGCFSIAYPWTEHRPDNYFPMPPAALAVQYATFTRRNRKIPVLLQANDKDKIRNANLDTRGPFYFISHGFLEGGHKSWIQQMTDALLNLEGNAAATVVVVDWRSGSQPPYGQAVANIRLVGVMTAHLIHNFYEIFGLSDLDNFHFIGHSLGAHLGGYCGHALQMNFNIKLGRITGLDPAAPYFSETVTIVRLDRSDAKYVDIIHSNAMPLYFSGFGISEAIGHVDFYPNGGSTQPGCKKADSPTRDSQYQQVVKLVGCNHERSYQFFTESINPPCPFIAVQCESFEAFEAGFCTTCDNKHYCLPMGYHSYNFYKKLNLGGLDHNRNIALYSLTGDSSPFCRVHYEVVLKVSNSTESFQHGAEPGKLSITLIDKNNNRTNHKFLDEEQKFYHPGGIEKKLVALRDTGHPPVSVIVEWKYETNLFNPITWRLLKSPSIYIESLKLSSIEYNTEKFYHPGGIEKKLVALRDTGHPPVSVIVEWKYETNLFNPITWRLLKSPSIYIESLKLSSIEYNTDITVCPKLNKPVVANLPTIMKPKYCQYQK